MAHARVAFVFLLPPRIDIDSRLELAWVVGILEMGQVHSALRALSAIRPPPCDAALRTRCVAAPRTGQLAHIFQGYRRRHRPARPRPPPTLKPQAPCHYRQGLKSMRSPLARLILSTTVQCEQTSRLITPVTAASSCPAQTSLTLTCWPFGTPITDRSSEIV